MLWGSLKKGGLTWNNSIISGIIEEGSNSEEGDDEDESDEEGENQSDEDKSNNTAPNNSRDSGISTVDTDKGRQLNKEGRQSESDSLPPVNGVHTDEETEQEKRTSWWYLCSVPRLIHLRASLKFAAILWSAYYWMICIIIFTCIKIDQLCVSMRMFPCDLAMGELEW